MGPGLLRPPRCVRREAVDTGNGVTAQRPRVGHLHPRAGAGARRRPERPHLGHRGPGARSLRSWPSTCPATGTPIRPGPRPRRGDGHLGRRHLRPPRVGRRWCRPSSSSRPRPGASSGCRSVGSPRSRSTARAPQLVRRLALVDVLPTIDPTRRADRRVHQRPRELRLVRRDPRAHDDVQPDPLRVVAAARRAAQRGGAGRRHVGVAPPAALGRAHPPGPAPGRGHGRRRREHEPRVRAALGRPRGVPGPDHARARASPPARSSTTTTCSNCCTVVPTPGSNRSRAPGTPCRATARSSSPRCSTTTSTPTTPDRRSGP